MALSQFEREIIIKTNKNVEKLLETMGGFKVSIMWLRVLVLAIIGYLIKQGLTNV